MPRLRRSKVEIIADVLTAVAEGCKPPTRVATEANMAYDRMTKLVQELMQKGLLREGEEGLCITREGHRFLQEYRRWRSFLSSLGI